MTRNRLFGLTFFFFLLFTWFFSANTALAQNYIKDKQKAIQSGNNQESWLNEAFGSNIITGINALSGTIPDSILDGTGDVTGWIPAGMLGVTNNLTASLYNQPASGMEYIAQVRDNFLGKPIYAQGVGFKGLEPLLPIWRGFRNIVYVLFSLFFVILGIMIMLRVKVSPQAVMTVQSAIPKLIISLILVTFSYAIAGLIIDFTYIIQGLVLTAIYNSMGISITDNLLKGPINTTFADISSYDFGTAFFLMTKNIGLIWILIIGGAIGAVIGGLIGSFVPIPIVGTTLGLAGGAGIGAALFLLIILIILLITLVKLLFSMIKCYVNLIIQIILGPLQIAMGAFPGSKMNFSTWILQIIANASVFPIVLIFLVLINVIAESISGKIWAPSIIALPGSMMPFIIAFGGLLMLTKLPDLIMQTVYQIKPSPFGQAVGESLKGITNNPATQAFKQGAAMEAGRKFNQNIGSGIDNLEQKIQERKEEKYKDKHKDDIL